MPGTQAVQPVHRDVPTYGPAPRKTENGDRVTGLQQSPLCIREEAKFITAHYGVQQMSWKPLFFNFFLGTFEWGDLWWLSILRVIRHFSVARQSNQQLFALNQAEKLSVTTRRYDLSGGKHHVCKIKETSSFFPDSPDCPVICWCSTSPSWLLQEKIRTKEWVENSWTGNSKLSFKHCVSLVPYLCSEGSVTQVSATRGWEVNRMLYSLSMNQLKKNQLSGGENQIQHFSMYGQGWRPI